MTSTNLPNVEPQKIWLWRDNRLEGQWSITLEDLAAQFAVSCWANYEWPLDRSVATFIGDRDGLSSVIDQSDFTPVVRACSDALRKSTGTQR